jgi:hypothetical protein
MYLQIEAETRVPENQQVGLGEMQSFLAPVIMAKRH